MDATTLSSTRRWAGKGRGAVQRSSIARLLMRSSVGEKRGMVVVSVSVTSTVSTVTAPEYVCM